LFFVIWDLGFNNFGTGTIRIFFKKRQKNIDNSDNFSLQTKKGDYYFNKIPTQIIQFLKDIDLSNF